MNLIFPFLYLPGNFLFMANTIPWLVIYSQKYSKPLFSTVSCLKISLILLSFAFKFIRRNKGSIYSKAKLALLLNSPYLIVHEAESFPYSLGRTETNFGLVEALRVISCDFSGDFFFQLK